MKSHHVAPIKTPLIYVLFVNRADPNVTFYDLVCLNIIFQRSEIVALFPRNFLTLLFVIVSLSFFKNQIPSQNSLAIKFVYVCTDVCINKNDRLLLSLYEFYSRFASLQIVTKQVSVKRDPLGS